MESFFKIFLKIFFLGIICVISVLWGSTLDLAFEAHSRGDLVKAEEFYLKALKDGENKAVIHYNLGNIYYGRNQLADAVMSYRRALESAPTFKEPYLNLGRIHYLYGNYIRALEVFLAYKEQDPDDYENTLLLADTYKKLRMYPEALEEYRRGVRAHPYQEEGYLALADFYMVFDDLEAARRETVAGYENIDFSKTLALYEADLLREQGNHEEAIAVYRGLLQSDQRTNFSPDALYEIQLKIVDSLLSLSNVNYAVFELEGIVEKYPQKMLGIGYLENIYIVHDKISRGFTFFKTLYDKNPDATKKVIKSFLAEAYNQDNFFLVKSIIDFFDRRGLKDDLAEAIKNEISF